MIARLFAAGADVFRINMSHTSHDAMRKLHGAIRAVEKETGRPIGILADLQGPKLRVGTFKDDKVMLEKGASFVLDDNKAPGDATRVYLPHPEILAALEVGHTLLLDDGKIRLTATETSPKRAVTRVEVGGKLSARKGVSLPDTTIGFSALTEKDRSDLEACLDTGVDWVALSFIQRPEDMAEAKKITRGRASVMAKIEKPQAVTRLAEIMDFTDALMVARGDLGVEMPLEQVPGIQKQITRASRRAGKPVVVATQMLESMITNPVPTRAEVSDVATAIFEGADAIMLSAESAAGQFPVEAGRNDESHRRGSRDRSDLSRDHPVAAQRSGSNRRRCHRGRGTADRRDARLAGNRLLDLVRLDRDARCARTAERADRRDLAEYRDRAQAGFGLGRALHRGGGRAQSRRHGGPRLPARLPRRVRQGRPAHHHRGGRAPRNTGRHQHGADRVRGLGRRRGLDLDRHLPGMTAISFSISATTTSAATCCTACPTPGSTMSFACGSVAASAREWMRGETTGSRSPVMMTVGAVISP